MPNTDVTPSHALLDALLSDDPRRAHPPLSALCDIYAPDGRPPPPGFSASSPDELLDYWRLTTATALLSVQLLIALDSFVTLNERASCDALSLACDVTRVKLVLSIAHALHVTSAVLSA